MGTLKKKLNPTVIKVKRNLLIFKQSKVIKYLFLKVLKVAYIKYSFIFLHLFTLTVVQLKTHTFYSRGHINEQDKRYQYYCCPHGDILQDKLLSEQSNSGAYFIWWISEISNAYGLSKKQVYEMGSHFLNWFISNTWTLKKSLMDWCRCKIAFCYDSMSYGHKN